MDQRYAGNFFIRLSYRLDLELTNKKKITSNLANFAVTVEYRKQKDGQ